MKSNEVADESYSINGFKHFSDLAVAYFPQMASTSSASKKMRNCIKASNALSEHLPTRTTPTRRSRSAPKCS